jgi:hypothetical protein
MKSSVSTSTIDERMISRNREHQVLGHVERLGQEARELHAGRDLLARRQDRQPDGEDEDQDDPDPVLGRGVGEQAEAEQAVVRRPAAPRRGNHPHPGADDGGKQRPGSDQQQRPGERLLDLGPDGPPRALADAEIEAERVAHIVHELAGQERLVEPVGLPQLLDLLGLGAREAGQLARRIAHHPEQEEVEDQDERERDERRRELAREPAGVHERRLTSRVRAARAPRGAGA